MRTRLGPRAATGERIWLRTCLARKRRLCDGNHTFTGTSGPPARSCARGKPRRFAMRKLAIGILAAAGVALSMPASAQGVWIGAGPVGVGVGVGPGYGGGYYDRGYYDGPRYRGYAYDDGYRRHCRVVRENINGYVR